MQPQETSDQERSYDLFTLQASGRNPITVQVDLNQVPTEMEVDTGASISLTSKDTYEVISKQSQIESLQKTGVKLKTYTGEAVQILGIAHVNVKYGEVEHKWIIRVADWKGPNLLGRDWLSNLKLTIEGLHNLSTPSALQNVLSKHATVFSDKLGELKDVKMAIYGLHVPCHCGCPLKVVRYPSYADNNSREDNPQTSKCLCYTWAATANRDR